MNNIERFNAVLNFQKPDRLPIIEWAPFWDKTIARWKSDGLPENINHHSQAADYFGLDKLDVLWVNQRESGCPEPVYYGAPVIHSEKDYVDIKKYLFPKEIFPPAQIEWMVKHQESDGALWVAFPGFFWFPRTLFGIENHLFAFYDYPDLMRRINEDLLEFLSIAIDEIKKYIKPQMFVLNEDLSYNHGPMISKEIFDEQLADFYVKAIEIVKPSGAKLFLDSDGLVDEPIDWYYNLGIRGFLPLEKQAGVDLVKYRKKYPDMLFLGGFDKMCMSKGEQAMREEFERLLPVMKSGGYILGVDHQTPPEVSLENYKTFLNLFREYATKAVV
ncbi:MAG: uroporphyrinogen decarboxylase family protein [Armatimonadota bacterium]